MSVRPSSKCLSSCLDVILTIIIVITRSILDVFCHNRSSSSGSDKSSNLAETFNNLLNKSGEKKQDASKGKEVFKASKAKEDVKTAKAKEDIKSCKAQEDAKASKVKEDAKSLTRVVKPVVKPVVQQPVETKETQEHPDSSRKDVKKVKKSLDKVLVGLRAKVEPPATRRPPIASKTLVKPLDKSSDEESVFDKVNSRKGSFNMSSSSSNFNGDESIEAQEIIRSLTKQLSDMEDKYVEEKADNVNKEEKIRKLTENISIISDRFEELKNDRSELVQSMKTNVELIGKLKIVTDAIGDRDQEIETLKAAAAEKVKTPTKISAEIKKMRQLMINQNRKTIELEVKLKENQMKETDFAIEKAEKDDQIEKLQEELKAVKSKGNSSKLSKSLRQKMKLSETRSMKR